MQARKCLSILGLVATAACLPAQAAGPYYAPGKAYDATYERKSPQGTTTMRVVSDGKGHVRIDRNSDKGTQVQIYDYNKGRVYMVASGVERVIGQPLQKNHLSSTSDEKAMKALGAKSLGSKEIDGHTCNGYEYKTAVSTVQSWIAEDTGCPISETAVTTDGAKSELKLTAYSATAPGAQVFAVPGKGLGGKPPVPAKGAVRAPGVPKTKPGAAAQPATN